LFAFCIVVKRIQTQFNPKSSGKEVEKHCTVPLPAGQVVPTMIKVTEIYPRHYYEGNFRSGKSDSVSRLCSFL